MSDRKKQSTYRIEWVNYYKAFAIILVVLGHATGIFNSYIYQFHVAAFFFISGYLSKIDQKKCDEIIIVRFFNLILPYIFYGLLGVSAFAVLNKMNLLYYVSSTVDYPGWRKAVSEIFGSLHCDWLGATWFLLSLYISYIIAKLCLLLDENKCGVIYLLASAGIFKLGYILQLPGTEYNYFSRFSLFFVVQFYFAAGHFCRNIFRTKSQYDVKKIFLIICVNILLMVLIKYRFGLTMDLASMRVNSPIKDAAIAANGISLLLCVSLLVQQCGSKLLKRGLEYLGNHTLGILIFHFTGFKVVTLLLAAAGICSWNEVALLCPAQETSVLFWPLYLIVSIIFSLVIWKMLMHFKCVRFFSGECSEKYRDLYQKYRQIRK